MTVSNECRLCDSPRKLTCHHLVPQRWFKHLQTNARKNDPRNLVTLCCYCHQSVEGDRGGDPKTRQIRRDDARRRLRAVLAPAEIAYVIATRGEQWLERHYPVVVAHHAQPPPRQRTTREAALAAWQARFR